MCEALELFQPGRRFDAESIQENPMNRRKALAALSLTRLGTAQTKTSAIRSKFVGVWKLVSCEAKDKSTGEVRYQYGVNPVGRITYDTAGRMSAHLMRPGRRAVGGSSSRGSAAVVREASADDMRDMLTGFNAYFGTFDIDESSQSVIHHVQGALIPSWVGTDLRRTYEFAGSNRLILTAATDQHFSRLVWQRDDT
jgi:hypothetical protein